MRAKSGVYTAILVCLFFSTATDGVWAQRRRAEPMGIRGTSDPADGPALPSSSLSRKMLKSTYDQLTKDIQELSDVSTAMREEVEKDGDEDILSLSIVHKAEQAEKLAKRIQSKMKNL